MTDRPPMSCPDQGAGTPEVFGGPAFQGDELSPPVDSRASHDQGHQGGGGWGIIYI